MELWQKLLIVWLIFVSCVYLYAWYDVMASRMDLRGKWKALMDAMTEEE